MHFTDKKAIVLTLLAPLISYLQFRLAFKWKH